MALKALNNLIELDGLISILLVFRAYFYIIKLDALSLIII